jgi:ribosomal-protein-alanine N-acetyltransferase
VNQLSFYPFPVFTTERLQIRQLSDVDAQALSVLRCDERVNRYIERAKQFSMEEAQAFVKRISDGLVENKWLYWTICFKDKSELIGTCCLWNFSADGKTAEVGYELSPLFQGQGIMSEVLTTVIKYSFEKLGLTRLEAVINNDNRSSIRLVEKYGFKIDPQKKYEANPNFLIYYLYKP